MSLRARWQTVRTHWRGLPLRLRRGLLLVAGAALLVLLLAVLLLAAYVMAPELSQQIPALAGPLKSYVALVDQARLALDGLLRAATGMLHGANG